MVKPAPTLAELIELDITPKAVQSDDPTFPWDIPERNLEPATKEEKLNEYLRLLSEGVRVRPAAKAVGLTWTVVYRLREKDPEFAAKWDKAITYGLDKLIKEAERRALNGSDRMLQFILTNYASDRFATNRDKLDVTGDINIAERILSARKRTGA